MAARSASTAGGKCMLCGLDGEGKTAQHFVGRYGDGFSGDGMVVWRAVLRGNVEILGGLVEEDYLISSAVPILRVA